MGLSLGSLVANAQTIPNLGLEQWTNHTYYDQPDGVWATANSIVDLWPSLIPPTTIKSTDAHTGVYSAKMESKIWPGANILMSGTLATGVFNNQSSNPGNALKRGTPYTQRPTEFGGWYKTNSVQGDSMIFYAWLTKWNGSARDTVGIALHKEYNTIANWTEFNLPFDYKSNDTPDSISIVFTSSAGGENLQGQPGNALWVDDITLTTATGIKEVLMPENRITVGPNPAIEWITMHFEKPVRSGQVSVYDAMGQLVLSQKVTGNAETLNLTGLTAGTYHYLLQEGETATCSGKFIKN